MNSKYYLIFWLLVLSLVPGISARGQETAGRPEYPWHASINVGMVGNVYENVGSYFRHNKAYDLVTGSLSVSAGYDFTEAFSVRLSLASDKNAGACNSLQSGGGFYPYVFSSLNVFADALYNVSRRRGHFVPKFYLGLGFAHTFNFRKERDWSHDWESAHGELPFVQTSNVVFGFRGGFLGEFLLSQEVGILVDVCGEFFTDRYDGLQPTSTDQESFAGYGGFPLDARGIVSLGIAYHF